MFPVRESNCFFQEKNGVLINSGHKTAAAIEKSEQSDDGVITVLIVFTYLCILLIVRWNVALRACTTFVRGGM